MKIVVVTGNDLREFSLNVSLGLENCVMGKNRRSEEAAFFFLFPLMFRIAMS